MQITYKKRLVKNLGNYESYALEIGIGEEVDSDKETYDEAYERVRKIVNNNLKSEFDRINFKKGEVNGTKPN